MDTDEDDPVVSEMPVHLCKELAGQLHLFQFPCQSSEFNNYTKNIVSSRVKPQNGLIELDYSLDTKSPHYDFYVGENLATAMKDSSKETDMDVETKLFDKLTLRSQRSILKKDINCYSVASVYDGKFCISTLEDAHSFLPSHEHREGMKKPNVKDVHSGSDASDDETDAAASAVPITVKFTHKSNEKTKISQEQSHYQYMQKTAEEPWCETNFYHSATSTALEKMEGLTTTVPRNRMSMMSLTEKQYLDVLIPKHSDDLIDTRSD